jgi:hypothetical protein
MPSVYEEFPAKAFYRLEGTEVARLARSRE